MTNPTMNAVRAGFQLVALESDLSNGGQLIDVDDNVVLKVAGGKRYLGHSPALNFSGDTVVSWNIDWTIEDNDEGTLTLYAGGVLGNGENGNSRDRTIFTSFTTEVGQSLSSTIDILETPYCQFDNRGSLSIDIQNGTPPFHYEWSNGDTTSVINSLIAGSYTVDVTDAENNQVRDSINLPFLSPEIEDFQVLQVGIDSFNVEISFSREVDILNFAVGDDPVETAVQGNTLTNIPSGNYRIFGSTELGCVSDTIFIEVNSLSHQEDIIMESFQVYPNPTRNFLNWQNPLINNVLVYDLQGRELVNQKVIGNQLDVSNLPHGHYMARFFGEEGFVGHTRFIVLD
jgi:hypothetical protein